MVSDEVWTHTANPTKHDSSTYVIDKRAFLCKLLIFHLANGFGFYIHNWTWPFWSIGYWQLLDIINPFSIGNHLDKRFGSNSVLTWDISMYYLFQAIVCMILLPSCWSSVCYPLLTLLCCWTFVDHVVTLTISVKLLI